MSLAFNIALHALLVGSMVFFVVSLGAVALGEKNPGERFLRLAALVAGAMVTLGAESAGIDYASFTVESLAGARPATALAQVGTTIVPALLGVGLGFFTVSVVRKSETFALRALCFIGMLTTTAFLQLYAEATAAKGVFLGSASLPNVAFVTGVILTVIFTYDPQARGERPSSKGLLSMFRRGASEASAAGLTPRAQKRDPFAP